jgi:hypothetical protein
MQADPDIHVKLKKTYQYLVQSEALINYLWC